MSVLNVPEDLLKRLGPNDQEALVEIACRLYETGRLRFDEAARLASMELDAFGRACTSRQIPVYWYDTEDLRSDVEALKNMGA